MLLAILKISLAGIAITGAYLLGQIHGQITEPKTYRIATLKEAQNIARLLHRHGMTQQEIAEALQVSLYSVRKLLS